MTYDIEPRFGYCSRCGDKHICPHERLVYAPARDWLRVEMDFAVPAEPRGQHAVWGAMWNPQPPHGAVARSIQVVMNEVIIVRMPFQIHPPAQPRMIHTVCREDGSIEQVKW